MRLHLLASVFALCAASTAHASEQLRIVGSSTVYPFVATVAEQFGRNTAFRTPIVEATGTGGGLHLFCSGAGEYTPDVANASRAIKDKEVELCKKNGVQHILELAIGYDGIVLANQIQTKAFALTREQVFLALAKLVPQNGKLVENPYQTWHDIDASLPNSPIEVYGPPPTSGTRDAFVELVMEPACKHRPEFVAAYADEKQRAIACHMLREDGRYVDAGENDNIIVQKLVNNPVALGIFGYSFLEQNADKVQPATIEGHLPSFENIVAGNYKISRSLYVYAKLRDGAANDNLKAFLHELMSEEAAAEDGYLAAKGLIPITASERAENLKKIDAAFTR